jgi:hypothetical protein
MEAGLCVVMLGLVSLALPMKRSFGLSWLSWCVLSIYSLQVTVGTSFQWPLLVWSRFVDLLVGQALQHLGLGAVGHWWHSGRSHAVASRLAF